MSDDATKAFWDQALQSFLPHNGISAQGVREIQEERPLTSPADRKAVRILLSRASGLPWGMLPPYKDSKTKGRGLR